MRYTVLLLALMLAGRCQGQLSYYLMEETAVQEKLSDRFEAAEKDYCSAVVRGGAPKCLVFSPTTFSPGGHYLCLLSFGSFGHYDEGTYTSKGLTPDQARELNERRSPTIASNLESGIKLHTKLSYVSSEPGALALITDFRIKPGSLDALRRYISEAELPAAHAAGMLSFEVYQVVAGGETNRFLVVRRFQKFAELDRVLPFGDAPQSAAKASPGGGLSIEEVRTNVMRVRPDLSAAR